MAKQCIKHYIKPLTYLINSSFESGNFPEQLKLAKVIPIFNLSINKGDILLDTTIISQVTFTKFLGVILEDKLKWTHHISYIKNIISKGMGIILKARNVSKNKVFLRLYHSFATP